MASRCACDRRDRRRPSRNRRRCRPTRFAGSPTTCEPSGGGAGKFPPGPGDFSLARTQQIAHDPLPILLGAYEEHGPIFSLRLLHTRVVFMLGPEANHFVTVAHPENFHWRESSFGDLIPLLGDGLLTIDDDYHDRARAIMMPAFHREQIAASVEAMVDRGRRGDRGAAPRRGRRHLRLDAQPGDADRDAGAARARPRRGRQGRRRGRALRAGARLLRDRLPAAPAARARLALAQDARLARRCSTRSSSARSRAAARSPDAGRLDILSLLLGARDEAGEAFTDREVRDQVMTLMFAGHDTSTSTLTFMMHELARHPDVLAQLSEEQDRVLGGDVRRRRPARDARCPTSTWSSTRCCASTRRPGSARAAPCASSSSAATRCPRAPTSTTAPGPATASPRSSPSPRRSSPSASPASARRRCRAAPTSPSAAARGSASASASARPR